MATTDPVRKQNFTAGRPPENGTEGPFSSQLITLNEPFGQYFAVMELGSPAAGIALIIDTGSEIAWVQCLPCRKCGSQIRDPIFDPSRSSTYRKLPCRSVWCKDAAGLAMGCRPHAFSTPTKSDTCFYNATYGDNSVSYGELSVDTLTIPSLDGNPVTVSEFVFGCGLENTGVETDFNASGLMGLDRGSHSVVSQLGVHKFVYCLPDRTHNIDATGFISFGNQQLLPSTGRGSQPNVDVPPPLQYTTLLLNNKTEFYAQSYYVNLTGISVERQLLDIPSSLFEIDEFSGYGGTIIDTGTSLTSFVDLAYAAFRDSVRSQVSGSARQIYIPELPSFDSCYTMPRAEGAPAAPEIRLHFDGSGLELRLPKSNVWLQVGTEGDRNVYCLAFAAAGQGAGGRNVIGNFQQQNFLVEYDLQRGRIGFAHLLQCSPAAENRRLGPFSWLRLLFLSLVFFVST